eukprot:6211916-Pleurochrysis_carterae.AAC.1
MEQAIRQRTSATARGHTAPEQQDPASDKECGSGAADKERQTESVEPREMLVLRAKKGISTSLGKPC